MSIQNLDLTPNKSCLNRNHGNTNAKYYLVAYNFRDCR